MIPEGWKKTKAGIIPMNWECVNIEDFSEQKTLRNVSRDEITVLSCTKYEGLVPSLQYFGKQIFSNDTSNYKIVKKNWFAYATNHIEEGSIGYQDAISQGLVSPMYTVFSTDNSICDKWFFPFFKKS